MIFCFDSELAKEYGLPEAIMIQCIQFWVAKNKANGKHFYDGTYWMYNSLTAFQKLLPFFSTMQIKRTLNKLVDLGIIKKGNYNQTPYDRTNWYGFVDESKFVYIDETNSESPSVEIDPPIPVNKPDIKQEKGIINNINIISNTEKENKKSKFGEFGNVTLTNEEYSKLEAKYGNQLERAITILDSYLEYKGKRYKSHYAVMKEGGWVWNETFTRQTKLTTSTKRY